MYLSCLVHFILRLYRACLKRKGGNLNFQAAVLSIAFIARVGLMIGIVADHLWWNT